jgi:hypothetical protein
MLLATLQSLGCNYNSITKISNFIEFYENPNNVDNFILKDENGNIKENSMDLKENFNKKMNQFTRLLLKFNDREGERSGKSCRETTNTRLKEIASKLSAVNNGRGTAQNYDDYSNLENAIKTIESFTSRGKSWYNPFATSEQIYKGGKRKTHKRKHKKRVHKKSHKKRRTYK